MSGTAPDEPRARRAAVRVPASSANLGSGFDCAAIAVPRWLHATAVVEDASPAPAGGPTFAIDRRGTLAALAGPPQMDLVVAGFVAACVAARRSPPARVALTLDSAIPVARGLGSSGAAIVAGARLADAALGLGLAPELVAHVAAHVEGQADNVVAAVYGGAMLSVPAASSPTPDAAVGARWRFVPLAVHPEVAAVVAAPDFPLTTRESRAVLPASVPHATATAAVARSAALVRGLACGDGDLLRAALDDVLHVPFRKHAVRGYDAVAAAAREAGAWGATLSGSGPSMLALAPRAAAAQVVHAMVDAWRQAGVLAEGAIVPPDGVPGATIDA